MKKNGFTLIELIAVIVILGIILLIVVPNVNDILNRSKTRLNEQQKEAIVSAARNWGMENLSLTSANKPSQSSVTIAALQQSGFLEDKEVKNLIDKKALPTTKKVCITYANAQFVYEYDGAC